MLAYVLIIVKTEVEYLVYNTLSRTPAVQEVYPLFSEWDLLIKIEAEDQEKLGEIIVNKIRPIDGILATKTLIGY